MPSLYRSPPSFAAAARSLHAITPLRHTLLRYTRRHAEAPQILMRCRQLLRRHSMPRLRHCQKSFAFDCLLRGFCFDTPSPRRRHCCQR